MSLYPVMNNKDLELSEQNIPKNNNKINRSNSSITASPAIVLTNADYKRPSSILSSRSEGSTRESTEMYLPVYWWGILMLACHTFIGMVTKIKSIILYVY